MHLVRRNVRSMPWVAEETLAPIGKQDSIGHDLGPRKSKSSSLSEEPGSMILRGYCGVRRSQRLWSIPSQVQGPRRGGRSAQGRMKGIQIARMYYRGRLCPRQAKIMGEKSVTLPEDIHSRIAKEIPSHMGQPQGNGGEAAPRKAVTSVLNTHN